MGGEVLDSIGGKLIAVFFATSIYIPRFRTFAFCCSLALEAGIWFAFDMGLAGAF